MTRAAPPARWSNRLILWLAAAMGFLAAAALPATAAEKTATATFGSGCFWCTEADFDKVPGVLETISGFTGGHVENPTYQQVVAGGTGHTEVVRITYDPTKVTYAELLDHYWRNVDPFDADGQFCDRGSQYRPAIFTHSEDQQRLAEESRSKLAESGRFDRKIVVEIAPAPKFTPAEDYHQGFYKKNPAHYWRYRIGCRRDLILHRIWGNPSRS